MSSAGPPDRHLPELAGGHVFKHAEKILTPEPQAAMVLSMLNFLPSET
jgi:hypothetical protein